MSAVTLNEKDFNALLAKASAPKRWLTKREAAEYLGVSLRTFESRVADGTIHKPSRHLGYAMPRWDRERIDEEMSSAL